MTQKLSAYQIYILRQLNNLPLMYLDMFMWKQAWLSNNPFEQKQNLDAWEEQLITEKYVTKEKSALFPMFPEDRERLFLRIEQKGRDYLMMLLVPAMDKVADTDNASANHVVINNDNKVANENKITIAAYGIMHVYIKQFEVNGQPVTEQNKTYLATKYGFNAATSGKQLKDEFDKFNNENLATAKTHIKRLESILPLLQNEYPKAFEAAKKDFDKYKKQQI